MNDDTVKWFNSTKGLGFIAGDKIGEEVLAHFSGVTTDGYESSEGGQEVIFDTIQGNRGPQAVSVCAA